MLFVLREGKRGLCLSDPEKIPRGQSVAALILCLVDDRMIASLWIVSWFLCTLKDMHRYAFLCLLFFFFYSFEHIFRIAVCHALC